jgi:hypothetical protein
MSRPSLALFLGLSLSAAAAFGHSTGASSSQYRLLSSGPTSVAASTTSALHQAQLAGGSGAPVGISASPNTSVVAGPISGELPTDRIFRGEFED